MVFEVKEFNNVIRFNIGRSEKQMAANMAEILQLNTHNSCSVRARGLLLVSMLWFSRARNVVASSDLISNYQKNKIAANMAEVWYSNGYISNSDSQIPDVGVKFMVLRSKKLTMSSDLKLDEQNTRCRSMWRKFNI